MYNLFVDYKFLIWLQQQYLQEILIYLKSRNVQNYVSQEFIKSADLVKIIKFVIPFIHDPLTLRLCLQSSEARSFLLRDSRTGKAGNV